MSFEGKKIVKKLGGPLLSLMEHTQDIVWLRSSDWQRYLYLSPSYESIFDVKPQTLIDNPGCWLDFVVTEDRDPLRQSLSEFLSNVTEDSLFEAEYRIRNSVNNIKWVKEVAVPIYEQGECVYFYGVANDITHLKHRESELHDASYFFKFFAEKIESVFWVRDKTGTKQLYLSPSYEKIWGRSVDSVYNNPDLWLKSLTPEDREKNKTNYMFCNDVSDCFDKKYENKFRITRPDGEIRWIKDINFPIFDDSGAFIGFAGISDDITNDVLREREMLRAKDSAEQANQANQAKSNFLTMMSHELRTPLNAVLGMAQILMNSKLTQEQRDHIEVIAQSAHNLLALLGNLLDFAKLEVGKLKFKDEVIVLYELVKRVIDDLQPQATAKKIKLNLDFRLNDPGTTIYSDPKRLSQILTSLISNAIKFTEQGYVRLIVSCVRKNKMQHVVCLTVEDTGIGIEKSKIQSVFGCFQQVDSVYQRKHDGVGLGLAMVKELVERMGGTVMVSSEPRVGSQFSCIIGFPTIKPDSISSISSVLPLVKSSGVNALVNTEKNKFNLNILVVEDNAINQKISRIMLEQLGCRVDIAACSAAAIDMIKNGYDLIFMDIGLPDRDGFETAQQIRKLETKGRSVPIIAMTAHVFKQDQDRCFEVGMNEVIAKPIVKKRLVNVLTRWGGGV